LYNDKQEVQGLLIVPFSHKHFFTHHTSLQIFQVTYNFQSSFISPELTSILSVKLEIFVQVKLSKTSPEFLVIAIAQIKLVK
jgi:hypothetical protein